MEINLILSFIGASIVLILMPGPDNIFVLTESLTKGQKNGIAVSIGLSSGIIVHTLAAATGLSIIVQKSALAFEIIKYLGAAYLIFLAYKEFKEKKTSVKVEKENLVEETSSWKLMRKGFFMNVLNPKVSLFFIAFLPQFVTPSGYNITLQMLFLGLLFMIQTVIIFSSIAVLSGKLSKYLNNSRFWKITKWGKVTVLCALGTALALSKK